MSSVLNERPADVDEAAAAAGRSGPLMRAAVNAVARTLTAPLAVVTVLRPVAGELEHGQVRMTPARTAAYCGLAANAAAIPSP